jgi:hypothetical protein
LVIAEGRLLIYFQMAILHFSINQQSAISPQQLTGAAR